MSIQDLLSYLNKPTTPPTSFETVCQVTVGLAYRGWGSEVKLFPFQLDTEDEQRAREECEKFLSTQPKGKWENKPVKGILTTILKDDVLTHPEGKLNNDWKDFVPESHNNNWAEESFSDEEKAIVNGDMPYNLVVNHLEKVAEAFTDDKPAWALVTREVDQWQKAKGKKRTYKDAQGNEQTTNYRILVIKEVFANKPLARKKAKEIKEKTAASPTQNDSTGGLSTTAITVGEWMSVEALKKSAYDDIKAELNKGVPVEKICSDYEIEESDLELIGLGNPL